MIFIKYVFKIMLILSAIKESPDLKLFPFTLYIVAHELIHILRFSKFLQNFEASHEEMMTEEAHVHETTHETLKSLNVLGMESVLKFYEKWRKPIDHLRKYTIMHVTTFLISNPSSSGCTNCSMVRYHDAHHSVQFMASTT